MTKHFNVTGEAKKKLVKAISGYLGIEAKYMRVPSCSYKIGNYTVEKDGTLSWLVNDENTAGLLEALKAEGFSAAEDEEEEVEEVLVEEDERILEEAQEEETEVNRLCISFPKTMYDERTLENLKNLVEAKGSLMKKAFKTESLEIVVDDEKVSFPWFELIDSDHFNAYTQFVTAISKMAKEQKRVLGKERVVENDKYAFRCFLLRLGFIGDEYKKTRKILLENLEGSAAFKTKKEEA